MTSARRLGQSGERVAVHLLESKGYLVRHRNVRTREGEIDIVAEREGVLVFVEVRARRGGAMGSAAESLTPRKQRRLVALAQAFVQAHADLPDEQRIDVITLNLAPDGRVIAVEHLENAVPDFLAL